MQPHSDRVHIVATQVFVYDLYIPSYAFYYVDTWLLCAIKLVDICQLDCSWPQRQHMTAKNHHIGPRRHLAPESTYI